MIIEIDYEIVSDEEFDQIKKNCTKIITEFFVNWLKEENYLNE